MLARFALCGTLLICTMTGCTFQPGAAATVANGSTTPEPIRGPISLGAGDALGERMFVNNAIARGPVLVETASLSDE